jgi:hypothetical protein
MAAAPNRAAMNCWPGNPAPDIASSIARVPMAAPFSAIPGKMTSSPSAPWPTMTPPAMPGGMSRPWTGESSPFIIAS